MNPAPLDPPGPRRPPDDEAAALAVLLRSSRLTLLRCPAGPARRALLRDGLLPLLHRRAGDASPATARHDTPARPRGAGATVLNFPERRGAARAGRPAPAELALWIDDWHDPSQQLHAQLAAGFGCTVAEVAAAGATLGARLHALGQRFNARLLVVGDGFDAALRSAAANDAPAADATLRGSVDELVDAMHSATLQVHWLLAVGDEADALTSRFRRRFAGLADAPLRLSHWDPPSLPSLPPLTVDTHAVPAPLADPAWAASLDRLLERAAEQARQPAPLPPPTDDEDPTLPFVFSPFAAPWVAPVAPVAAAVVADVPPPPPPSPSTPIDVPAAAQPAPMPRRLPPSLPRSLPWALVAAGLAGLLVWLVWPGPAPPSSAPAPGLAKRPDATPTPTPTPTPMPTPTPAATPAPAPLPQLALAVDSEDGATPPLAADLQRAVARPAGLGLRVEPAFGWADSLAAPGGARRLVLVRYDALQALRRGPAGTTLQLLTPLVGEAIHVIARADSPLRRVHEIEAARINIGPAVGSRALTAQTVYQRLFAHPLPAAQRSEATRDAALRELLDTRSIEVLVLVDAAPSRWLAALPAARRAGLRLLPLDAAHPASRRALQAYLPTTLDGALPALAVMSFLAQSGAGAADPLTPRLLPALCDGLGALRRDGHPAWRHWQPGLQLPAGWPYAADARSGLAGCPSPAPVPAPVPPPPTKGASA